MEAMNLECFTIVQLNKKDVADFQKLIQLFADVFETDAAVKPDNIYLEKLLAKPDFLVLAVFQGDKIVGGLTGYELQKYHREMSEFFLYDIAIDPNYQQRGLGTRLIARLKEICHKKGISEFFVDAHLSDAHALRFYESITSRQDQVVQFSFN
jgi:aminoglycoside 3-N-acetyltransferase I